MLRRDENLAIANRWFRCTYTVKHDGSISLYVDAFLMYQGNKMAKPFVHSIGMPLVIGRTVDAQSKARRPGSCRTSFCTTAC